MDLAGIAFKQQCYGVPTGRAGMDIQRQIQLYGQFNESFEDLSLQRSSRIIFNNPVIQADLTDGHQASAILTDKVNGLSGLI